MGTAVAAYGDEEASDVEVAADQFAVAGEEEQPSSISAGTLTVNEEGWWPIIGFALTLVIGVTLAALVPLTIMFIIGVMAFRMVYGR